MQLDYLYIKGFRNYKEATINFNKSTLIIGANDVGKTNLIYALQILMDRGFSDYSFELKDSDFYAYENTKEVVIRAYLTDVVEDCVVARMPGYISNDSKMVLQYKAWYENDKVEYQFYCGKSDSEEDLKECPGPYYRKYINIKYIGSRRDFWGYINKSKKELLNKAKQNRSDEVQATDDSLYHEIEEKLRFVDEKIPELSFVKTATDQLNGELSKLSIHNKEQQVLFDTSAMDIEQVISNVSISSKHQNKRLVIGGEGRINQIYLSLWATQNQQTAISNEVSIICIEEPEAYLHPHQQRELATYLGEALNGQVILTSHSPFIVSEFSPNSIIRLYKDENSETKVASDGCSKAIEDGFEGLGYRMSVLPAEAFFADYVILVEGPSEEMLYRTLANQIGIDLDRLNISVLCVNGVDFVTYIKILDAMEIRWSVRTDNDEISVPRTTQTRYAGIERGIDCFLASCEFGNDEDRRLFNEHRKHLRYTDTNNIPQEVTEAVEWFKVFLDRYYIEIADVDLETDLYKSSLHDTLNEFYDPDDKMTGEEVIKAMKKHKAINMYQFLKANKSKLYLLKEDKIATPLVDARNVIEELYGSDSDSEKHN